MAGDFASVLERILQQPNCLAVHRIQGRTCCLLE